MTDGEGRKTVFGYDALGNTITVTTGAGTTGAGSLGAETTTYTYDAENNLRNVVDALGNSATAGFDPNTYGAGALGISAFVRARREF